MRAEASVRMSFDKVSETKEAFDPEGQVARSTQSVNATSKSNEANGAVSAQNNLPNADTGNQNAGSQEGRQEETTNYEISKTVRTLLREQPQIDRISLAVMVDGVEQTAGAWQPRSTEDLDRITALVKSAIGFDDKRGDQVNVVSMRFVADTAPAAEAGGLLGIHFEKPDLMRLAQSALFGVIGLLALLLVLRPMVLRLTALSPGTVMLPDGTTAPAGTLLAAGGSIPAIAGPAGLMALPAPGASGPGQPEEEAMVSMNQIEGQMRASSLRKLADIVSRHPEETLTIMRGWMAQENG